MKRSKWKGPLVKKIKNIEKKAFLPRNYEVTSKLLGTACYVHNGKKFVKLSLNQNMVGYKVGEFIHTRKSF